MPKQKQRQTPQANDAAVRSRKTAEAVTEAMQQYEQQMAEMIASLAWNPELPPWSPDGSGQSDPTKNSMRGTWVSCLV